MEKRITIFDIPVDCLTMDETVELVEEAIRGKKSLHHTVINAGKIVAMRNDSQLYQSVVSADIINADGQAVVWASKILGKALPERVSGIDLMEKLVQKSFQKGYKIYFLGAKQEILMRMVERYSKLYSSTIIAGYRDGYFSTADEQKIAKEISCSKANILFVAMSSPKKENFLFKYKNELSNINLIMGVGGSFDVVAGKVKRAPLWIQKIGLEWLFRLVQEPKRMWRRYMFGNYEFIRIVFKEYFKMKS